MARLETQGAKPQSERERSDLRNRAAPTPEEPETLHEIAIAPLIGKDEAARRLSRPWPRAPLRALAEVWIPYHASRIRLTAGGEELPVYYAVDAVSGRLDLLTIGRDDGDPSGLASRNRLPVRLAPLDANRIVEEKVRRMVFARGFFRVRRIAVRAQPAGVLLFMPYWVGFFGRQAQTAVRVMSATGGRMEGAKARELVTAWLAEDRLE